jgi:hypothetical protein
MQPLLREVALQPELTQQLQQKLRFFVTLNIASLI